MPKTCIHRMFTERVSFYYPHTQLYMLTYMLCRYRMSEDDRIWYSQLLTFNLMYFCYVYWEKWILQKRTGYIYIYIQYIACNLHVSCMWAACELHVSCIWAACELHVSCMWAACELHVSCMWPVPFTHLILGKVDIAKKELDIYI